jgi:hypothetical protein
MMWRICWAQLLETLMAVTLEEGGLRFDGKPCLLPKLSLVIRPNFGH